MFLKRGTKRPKENVFRSSKELRTLVQSNELIARPPPKSITGQPASRRVLL
jgi:hypothetical protein